MSDLDEAIESGELKRVIDGMDIAGIHPSLKLLCDAARRLLEITKEEFYLKPPNQKGVRHWDYCLHDEPGVTICTCEDRL